ncbi:hypothetical protein ACFQ0G_03790 [Streptomyces chiangmaiensis]
MVSRETDHEPTALGPATGALHALEADRALVIVGLCIRGEIKAYPV